MCCKCCEDKQAEDRVIIPLATKAAPAVEFLYYDDFSPAANCEKLAASFNAWMRDRVPAGFYDALRRELR